MRVKEGVEAGLVGAGEGVAAPQQQERALNTSGSKAGLTPWGSRRWMSRRTAVSPAQNHLMTWKRSSTWRAWGRQASTEAL